MRPNIVSAIEMVWHVMMSADASSAGTRKQEKYHSHCRMVVSVERVDV